MFEHYWLANQIINAKMNKREFIKTFGMAAAGLTAKVKIPSVFSFFDQKLKRRRKEWTWISTETKTSEDEWKKRFSKMKGAGIDAVLPEIYNSRRAFYGSKHLPVGEPWLEQILPLAKAEGLEVHAWMWTMPCNIPDVVEKHPDWFVVNRLGESSAVKPAYVNYYKFLCPSRSEVWEFIQETVKELSQYSELDGIHLDYIRYPEVILPVGLQRRYNIIQDREYPQYDYCYCDVCQHDFEKETGKNPMKLDDPSADISWRKFRYDRITHIVDDILIPVARKQGKKITAAVFPNWENVRQRWFGWNLDGAMPMLYAGFYNEGIDWIKEQTSEEVKALGGRAPVYSGLSVAQLAGNELSKAMDASYDGGADGVSLFNVQAMTADQWEIFKKAVKV